MPSVPPTILENVLADTVEPTVIISIDQSEWPVVLVNRAFETLATVAALGQPFADVIEQMLGRDLALEISEAVRSRQETSFPVEQAGREFLLSLKPLQMPGDDGASFCAAFWRSGGASAPSNDEVQHALLKAKRRIRDLTRDDPVTGLLNERAFREVLEHDWAVASREKGTLALVVFVLDDFDAYFNVFGRHASDSCLRQVGRAIRRRLRRARECAVEMHRNRKLHGVSEEEEEVTTTRTADVGTTHDPTTHGPTTHDDGPTTHDPTAHDDGTTPHDDEAWEIVNVRRGWIRRLAVALRLA